jgi:hypothetical protein
MDGLALGGEPNAASSYLSGCFSLGILQLGGFKVVLTHRQYDAAKWKEQICLGRI